MFWFWYNHTPECEQQTTQEFARGHGGQNNQLLSFDATNTDSWAQVLPGTALSDTGERLLGDFVQFCTQQDQNDVKKKRGLKEQGLTVMISI